MALKANNYWFAASIFAYGQTSSGKTYTMTGITEFAVADIFDYIFKVTLKKFFISTHTTLIIYSFGSLIARTLQHEDRAFVVKFSAIEIYNEAIRDLLSPDSPPLRLRDDPEVEDCCFSLLQELFLVNNLLCFCHSERGRR